MLFGIFERYSQASDRYINPNFNSVVVKGFVPEILEKLTTFIKEKGYSNLYIHKDVCEISFKDKETEYTFILLQDRESTKIYTCVFYPHFIGVSRKLLVKMNDTLKTYFGPEIFVQNK